MATGRADPAPPRPGWERAVRHGHTPAVRRYQIVPGRSRIDITARPALPGVRLVIDEVSGSVELDEGEGDTASGSLIMWVQAIIEDPARAPGAPAWLRTGEPVAAEGRLERARCADGQVEVGVRIRLDARTVPFTGAGRIEHPHDDEDAIDAVGITVVDPRTLGFALPPLVTYSLHTRWRLRLVPG
jgi:hypothetical protein